jgi:hypothetical protein
MSSVRRDTKVILEFDPVRKPRKGCEKAENRDQGVFSQRFLSNMAYS